MFTNSCLANSTFTIKKFMDSFLNFLTQNITKNAFTRKSTAYYMYITDLQDGSKLKIKLGISTLFTQK